MIDAYDWAHGREAMLRFGPAGGPTVLATLPLFEEANRTRAFTVTMLRALARQGIAGALPDLPGTGESAVPTDQASLADWRAAHAAAAASLDGPVHALSIRGGALIDTGTELASRWHLTPVAGQDLVRDLFRMRAIAEPGVRIDFDPLAPSREGPPVELAGNRIARALLCDLIEAVPQETGRLRVVRLGKDRRIADLSLPQVPTWRRAEPENDPELAERLALDLAEWIAACGA